MARITLFNIWPLMYHCCEDRLIVLLVVMDEVCGTIDRKANLTNLFDTIIFVIKSQLTVSDNDGYVHAYASGGGGGGGGGGGIDDTSAFIAHWSADEILYST
ncbi:hypothetical protein T4A_12262 [Trichinella pseudospiralis]|uniref:Uncharacterized protein n=1 Tax=Trichinella pseudospiralis TaxID=6337 RepID=A0A0V1EJK5_TRIPS|nr:hypothetical protein T4A_12262 [Trichinella pseudospiralis]